MGNIRNAYMILIGNLEETIPFRRPWRRYDDSIKMDLKEIGCEGVA
jgi:hypothetical protein